MQLSLTAPQRPKKGQKENVVQERGGNLYDTFEKYKGEAENKTKAAKERPNPKLKTIQEAEEERTRNSSLKRTPPQRRT